MQNKADYSIWSWGGESLQSKKPTSTLQSLIQSLQGYHEPFLTYYEDGHCLRRKTFHQFFEDAQNLSQRLRQLIAHEWESGLRIAVIASNSDAVLVVYAACFLLNITIVPINPGESDQFIDRIVDHADCKLLLSDTARRLTRCQTVTFNELSYVDCEPRPLQEQVPQMPLQSSEDIAAIFYTSGTTSQSKGVMLSHRAIFANIQALSEVHSLLPDSIHYCVLPMYHVNAFGFSFLTVLYSRSQLVLSDRFRADSFWRIIGAESCHTCNVVPEIVSQLIAKTAISYDLALSLRQSIKYFVSAASALSRDLAQKFLEKFSIKIVQGYGLSETVNFSLLVSPFLADDEYHAVMLASPRPSVGEVLPGNDVTVRRVSDDGLCNPGEIGEIAIRGWNLMSAYLNNPKDTQTAFRNGWFRTGDLGYYLERFGKRYFYISGRIKEIVKRKSETIYVQEVEESLQTISGCAVSAVAGFPNRWTGEELGAVVVPVASTPTADEILAEARSLMGYDKAPKVVIFVDKIPRTASMKIKRRELSALFVDQESQSFSHPS